MGVSAVLSVLAVGGLLLILAGAVSVLLLLSRRLAPKDPDFLLPPISVLKPLAGLDDDLLENLLSLARQDYPHFELIFAAEDPRDPALGVAEHVQRLHPALRIRIVYGSAPFGRNPKVQNLAAMLPFAQHDALLISDSNVRVGRQYLRTLVRDFDGPGVGMVSNLVMGRRGRGVGATLENLQSNTWLASALAAARSLSGHVCVLGKSILLRRSVLERLGGLAAVKDVLHEDYVLGQMFARAGQRVVHSPYRVESIHTRATVDHFIQRHLRWSIMRRRANPAAYAVEALSHPLVWASLLALVALATQDQTSGLLALVVILGKLLIDIGLFTVMTQRRPSVREMLLLPVKDGLIFGIWAVAMFQRRVVWRGHLLEVGRGAQLVAVRPSSPSLAPEPQEDSV